MNNANLNKKLLITLIILTSAVVFFIARFGLFSGTAPADLGVIKGHLKAPSKNENSVSSQAELFYKSDSNIAYARIPPLNYKGTGKVALTKLKQLISTDFSEAKLVEESEFYLRYEFKTALMNFVDDVEFLLNENENYIHFRSASRLGRKDMGKNRARMEAIRDKFAELNE